MKRILLVLTAAAIMVAMMAATAVPAFAADDKQYLCPVGPSQIPVFKVQVKFFEELTGGQCTKIKE